jgi:hypothetical protein
VTFFSIGPLQSLVHPVCFQSYIAVANRPCINDCNCPEVESQSAGSSHAPAQRMDSHSETEISLAKVWSGRAPH